MTNFLISSKKRRCDWCKKKIKKRDWFYLDNTSFTGDGKDIIICEKCGHEQDEEEKQAMGYYDPVSNT